MKHLSERLPRILMLCGVAAYVLTFSVAYAYILSPSWSYEGFIFEPGNPVYFVGGFCIALIPALWMPVDLERPSQLVYWILYVVVIIPGALVPGWIQTKDPDGMFLFQVALV